MYYFQIYWVITSSTGDATQRFVLFFLVGRVGLPHGRERGENGDCCEGVHGVEHELWRVLVQDCGYSKDQDCKLQCRFFGVGVEAWHDLLADLDCVPACRIKERHAVG